MSPRHLKAFFRLVSVLLALGRPHEALEALGTYKYDSKDKSSERLLADLTRRCNAFIIVRAGVSCSKDPETLANAMLRTGAQISARTAKILAKLSVRRQREDENCTHAWRDWQPSVEDQSSPLTSSSTNSEPNPDTDATERQESSHNSIFQCLSEGESKLPEEHKKIAGCGIPSVGFRPKKEKSAADLKAASTAAEKKKKNEFLKMIGAL